jgi:hypothetical protein
MMEVPTFMKALHIIRKPRTAGWHMDIMKWDFLKKRQVKNMGHSITCLILQRTVQVSCCLGYSQCHDLTYWYSASNMAASLLIGNTRWRPARAARENWKLIVFGKRDIFYHTTSMRALLSAAFISENTQRIWNKSGAEDSTLRVVMSM